MDQESKKHYFNQEQTARIEAELEQFSFLQKFHEVFSGGEIYLVGGAVRDFLLQRPTKDYDFVARKVEAEKLKDFLESLGTVNFVGKHFGVFKFIPKDWPLEEPIDVALPRNDFSFQTGGYRDVRVEIDSEMPIEEDLKRRDFTINALALNLSDKKRYFIDAFGGLEDLNNKIIRAIGDPEQRFSEDYSRMLRALRFACQFSRTQHDQSDWQIDPKTWESISRNIHHLNDVQTQVGETEEGSTIALEIEKERIVPYEVIAKEFLKSFKADPVKAFDLYEQSGAFQELIPEIINMKNCPQPERFHSEGDVYTHTKLALNNLYSKEFQDYFGHQAPSLELILSVLFHDIGKPETIQTPEKNGSDRIRFNNHDKKGEEMTRKICERLRLSSPDKVGADVEAVARLVSSHMVCTNRDIPEMKANTIAKYFFNDYYKGDDLLKLSFVDIMASIQPNGKSDFTNFELMQKRVDEIKNLSQSKKDLPAPLLNGGEIMEEFAILPGPQIGEILNAVREEQLAGHISTKAEALDLVFKKLKAS